MGGTLHVLFDGTAPMVGLVGPGSDRSEVAALSMAAHIGLSEVGMAHLCEDAFLSDEILDGIRAVALSLATGWADHLPDQTVLVHEGISLPNLVEQELFYGFAVILKMVEVGERLIHTQRPAKVVMYESNGLAGTTFADVGEDGFPDVLSRVCVMHGVPVERVRPRAGASRPARKATVRRLAGRVLSEIAHLMDRALQRWGPTVAFLTQRGVVPEILRPVIDELKRRKSRGVMVLADGRDASSIRSVPLGTAISPKMLVPRRTLAAVRARMERTWDACQTNGSFRRWFDHHRGTPFWPVVEPYMSRLFRNHFVALAIHISGMAAVVREHRVRLLVTHTEWPALFRAWIRSAQNQEAAALCILNSPPLKDLRLAVPGLVDRLAVYGEGNRDHLVAIGVPAEKMVLTGHPGFDRYVRPERPANRVHGELFGAHPFDRIVLFEPENYVDREQTLLMHRMIGERKRVIRELLTAIREVKRACLVIAPRPTDRNIDFLSWCVRAYGGGQAKLVVGHNPADLLPMCDAVIVHYSLLGVEAMMHGTPVVVLNLTGRPDRMPFVKAGGALGVYTVEDIAGALHTVLDDVNVRANLSERMREFVRDYAGVADGRSAGRIADLIERMTPV